MESRNYYIMADISATVSAESPDAAMARFREDTAGALERIGVCRLLCVEAAEQPMAQEAAHEAQG
jgi:hypothetical protein